MEAAAAAAGAELTWAEQMKAAQAEAAAVGQGGTPPPIIYSSRTHSQLAQVMRELQQTAYKCVHLLSSGSNHIISTHDANKINAWGPTYPVPIHD